MARFFNHNLAIALAALVVFMGTIGSGCASYSEQLQRSREAVIQGSPSAGIAGINELLEVEETTDLPEELDDESALLLLERATLYQALGDYQYAARDMIIADQRMEWLDISGTSAGDIAKFLYSDSASTYRAPPYERLLLNTFNIVNFLALNMLEGARVEARRFQIMESFYIDDEGQALQPDLLTLGNYLGGVAFEHSRDFETAARYYVRAWHFGYRTTELRQRLVDLFRVSAYSGRELQSESLAEIRAQAQGLGAMSSADYSEKHLRGDTLILTQTGVAPYKAAVRMPVETAVGVAQQRGRYGYVDDYNETRALELAATGALLSVSFPNLTRAGLPPRREVRVKVAGRRVGLHPVLNVDQQVWQAWQELVPTLITSAITRAVARVVAGQVSGAVAESAADSESGGVWALLISLLVQGTMTAADTPDTRSWTSLPSVVRLARLQLKPGEHVVSARIGQRVDRRKISVEPKKINLVNFSRIR